MEEKDLCIGCKLNEAGICKADGLNMPADKDVQDEIVNLYGTLKDMLEIVEEDKSRKVKKAGIPEEQAVKTMKQIEQAECVKAA